MPLLPTYHMTAWDWLDFALGCRRWYRRWRGGRWLEVFHVPSHCGGWVRRIEIAPGEMMCDAEDYSLPRARALP